MLWFKHSFIDIQTCKELIQMDINKMMTNGIFTMNGKHTHSKNKQQIYDQAVMQTFWSH